MAQQRGQQSSPTSRAAGRDAVTHLSGLKVNLMKRGRVSIVRRLLRYTANIQSLCKMGDEGQFDESRWPCLNKASPLTAS